MRRREFHDGDFEMIEVPLVMRRQNFDALVEAGNNDAMIPVGRISFAYDEGAVDPVVRLMVNSDAELKEIQRQMGFLAGPVDKLP